MKSFPCTKVRLCSEGVTILFPKGFDRQNIIFLHPHDKRKPAAELYLSAVNFESSRAISCSKIALTWINDLSINAN